MLVHLHLHQPFVVEFISCHRSAVMSHFFGANLCQNLQLEPFQAFLKAQSHIIGKHYALMWGN